jgi:abhydrolase domain-containing protein 12
MLISILRSTFLTLLLSLAAYVAFLALLTIPVIQSQVIYLNYIRLTWTQDLNRPEQWGFMRNQATPFTLRTPDAQTLHAWHILPLNTYHHHAASLAKEPTGLAPDITQRHSFRLLRDDPSSLLVLYLHGAAGTLGSGYRPPSYRALSAAAPSRIHVVAIDYRGFGRSTGAPSEAGFLTDALALVRWATQTAGVPPERIVVFGQSLGTAVALALVHHLATAVPPAERVYFAGVVLVAPLVDVERLTESYRVAGTIPLLSPLARFPRLLRFFNGLVWTKWSSGVKVAEFVHHCEREANQGRRTVSASRDVGLETERARYHITMIHAKDDYDIPWTHTEQLYWHAVNASLPQGIRYDELEQEKDKVRQPLGAGGWVVERATEQGVLREEIVEFGLHDRLMSYPVVSLAVWRAFNNSRADSGEIGKRLVAET